MNRPRPGKARRVSHLKSGQRSSERQARLYDGKRPRVARSTSRIPAVGTPAIETGERPPARGAAMNRRQWLGGVLGAAAAPLAAAQRSVPAFRAGAAAVDITPQDSLWMAGFARRKLPAQGTALPLHAKGLALQSGREAPLVLVTVDLLGLTARITDRAAALIRQRHGIPRENILFNASHTHCGPVVDEQLSVAYDLSPAQWEAIRAYTARLERMLVEAVDRALERLAPARVSFGRDRATFAANRRVSFSPQGPVDHAVPVLRVESAAGALRAIVFGYACHNTTLQDTFVRYHGDYAGVAQAVLERRHPGALALYVAGCGADANPSPRGTVEHVEAHGAALADAVDSALSAAQGIGPGLRAAYGVVDLPFADDGVREQWRSQLKVEEVYLQRHAALMTAASSRDGALPRVQPVPVQVWRFDGLALVAIGGEVVVDYALRLAREYPDSAMWAAGYSNDVFGYLPSERVLREGGYEGADAMIYYGRPGPFAAGVEARVFGEVARLMRRTARPAR